MDRGRLIGGESSALLTTVVEADRPFSMPCVEPGFSDLGGIFGLVMRWGLAVTARLDLGPTEVVRGITKKENKIHAIEQWRLDITISRTLS